LTQRSPTGLKVLLRSFLSPLKDNPLFSCYAIASVVSCAFSGKKWRLAVEAVPLLLSAVIGFILGLLTLGLARSTRLRGGDASPETRDDLLLGLLVLAAFALGGFVLYILVGFRL
jgi:hypothetical protein